MTDANAVHSGVEAERSMIPKKAVVAGLVGHALEVYDYVIFGLVAAAVAAAFLPAREPGTELLQAFIVFAAGFAIRPIGGLVLGHIGDTSGRRNVLVLVVGLGALSTIFVGLLPTYAAIGILAPVLLLVARLAQGFAGGGEAGSSFPFMVEYAPEGKRGVVGSLQQIGTLSGQLLATGVVGAVTLVMSQQAFDSWGWRLPFLFAIVPGVCALLIRLGVAETPKFVEAKERREVSETPVREAFTTSRGRMLIMGCLAMFVNFGYLAIQVFNINYVQVATDLQLRPALIANAIGLAIMIALLPVWGRLSDRIGRKPLLLGSIVAFTAVSYPAYALMAQGTFVSYLLGQVILGVTITAFSGTFVATVVELFPLRVRASGLSFAYNVTGIVAIGLTPAAMAYLSGLFDYSPIGPVLWILVGAVIGLVGVLSMEETAHAPLRVE